MNSAVYGQIQELLGDLLVGRVEVEESAVVPLGSFLYRDDMELHFAEFLRYQGWTFTNLNRDVTLVDGRMPQHIIDDPNDFILEMEGVIGLAAFENISFDQSSGDEFRVEKIQVGDQLRSADGSFRIHIVGVVQPNDLESDVWWGDLRPFEFERAPLNGANLPETVTVPVIVPHQTMADTLGGGTRSWRLLLDSSQITVNNVDQVYSNLSNASSNLRINLESGLLGIIERFQLALANAQVTLFLLTVQSLIFVLYTLAMISSFLLEQSRGVLATLAGRGFNGRQITQLFATQGFLLAFLGAAPLGPLVARGLLILWGAVTNTVVPTALAAESWQLSFLAAGFSWLTLVVAIYSGTRGNILDWQRQLGRPSTQAGWQKYYLDIFLLLLGGLIYWQLQDSGTVVAQLAQDEALAAAGVSDPLLLLGPSLLLIAVALIFLRLFPYLLRLASWWANQVRGLILPFGLAKLSRDPVGPSRVVLLISLAAGLTLFASLFEHSLGTRQAEIAHYNTGADIRVGLPIDAGTAELAELANLTGVEAASAVYFNGRIRVATNLGQQLQMVAIDPETLPQVSRYAPICE